MRLIKHHLELLVNPFFILFFLILICIFLMRNKKDLLLVRSILWSLAIIFMVFSTGWLPRYVTEQLESSYAVVQKVNPKIKWVVVLGGGHSAADNLPANDLLSSASIKRLVEGVRLLKDLPDAKLLLSGGGEEFNFTEAVLLSKISQWFLIPEQRIVLEANSVNTEDQARALVGILHNEPFYLVTSAIHMPRTMFLCQQQGLNPIPAPTDYTFFWRSDNPAKMYIPNVYNFYYFTIALHELLGRAWASSGYAS